MSTPIFEVMLNALKEIIAEYDADNLYGETGGILLARQAIELAENVRANN